MRAASTIKCKLGKDPDSPSINVPDHVPILRCLFHRLRAWETILDRIPYNDLFDFYLLLLIIAIFQEECDQAIMELLRVQVSRLMQTVCSSETILLRVRGLLSRLAGYAIVKKLEMIQMGRLRWIYHDGRQRIVGLGAERAVELRIHSQMFWSSALVCRYCNYLVAVRRLNDEYRD